MLPFFGGGGNMAKPDKYLMYPRETIKAVATHRDQVVIELDLPDAGLQLGVVMAVRMAPADARILAKQILQSADDAERQAH